MNKISVILLSYNPVHEELIRSIKSVIFQEGIDFDLIISDDGSQTFFESELEQFFDKNNFHNFQIITHKKNNGTVANILDALNYSKSEYIKLLGQGDLLCDRMALKQIYEEMSDKHYDYLIHKIVCFAENQGQIQVVEEKRFPQNFNIYSQDAERIKKYHLLFSDQINGASVAYKKDLLQQYLYKVSGEIKLTEDIISMLIVAEKKNIGTIDKPLVMYKVGDGVSTKKVNNQYLSVLAKDKIAMDTLVKERMTSSVLDQRIKKQMDFDIGKNIKPSLIRKISYYLINPEIALFKFRCLLFTQKTETECDKHFVETCMN